MTTEELKAWAIAHASGAMQSSVAKAVLELIEKAEPRSHDPVGIAFCEHCRETGFGTLAGLRAMGWDVTDDLSCTVCKKCRRRSELGESGA